MDQIYKRASAVVAWLGDVSPQTFLALYAIRRIATIPEDQDAHYSTLTLSQLGIPDPLLYGLVGLLRRAWFTRVWIVQEALLAKRLLMLWGSHEIPHSQFVKTAHFLVSGSLQHKLADFRG